MEEKEEKKLFMPSNISTNKNIMPGLLSEDIRFIALTFVIGLVLSFFIYFITKSTITSVIFLFILMICSYGLVVRDSNNVNAKTYLVLIIKYLKSQKKYKYINKEVNLNAKAIKKF